MFDSTFDVDKLTCEIFSILENKFLFGYDEPKLSPSAYHEIPLDTMKSTKDVTGKVRILSIDGGGSTNGLLAAKSLAYLEDCLRRKSTNPKASIADYFDVVAGSGAGGILAALLFTRGKDGRPICTAEEALKFIADNGRRIFRPSSYGIFRRTRMFRSAKAEKVLGKIFGECTLKDTLKSVLIPCYDFFTRAPFLFSRADAVEMDSYDFKMADVCMATSADPAMVGSVELRSVDKTTRIVAVDGGVAMNNPTAAAITHVLNNKQEFPFCSGVEDLLVVSLGNGDTDFGADRKLGTSAEFVRIASEGASDMVDQAVSMAFGPYRSTNFVRIQGNSLIVKKASGSKLKNKKDQVKMVDEMLAQKNVESVLFQGKKLVETTNLEKLELFGGEIIKEQEKRKTNILQTVVLKQLPSPRTSSATTLSTLSSY